jgi:hypothetical protein
MKACRCVGEEGVWVKVGRFIIASKQSSLYRKVNQTGSSYIKCGCQFSL